VRVQLGSGQKNYLAGWYNVDANFFTAKIDIWADLRNPLPFPSETVDCFYSHHVIEHLPDDALALHFHEMFRCLKPGGVIRVGGPDAEAAAKKFLEGDANWFSDYPDKHASMGGKFTNFIICRGEHLTLLSYSYLREIAECTGFAEIQRCIPVAETGYPDIFREALGTEFESDHCCPHTILIEARKPTTNAIGR
jgi:predicted SAM-dependent methyltransferase